MNSSLKLENLSNITLQGLPAESRVPKVRILFEASVTVTWEKCSNVEISSVTFLLLDNFTHNNYCAYNQTKTACVLLRDIYIVSHDDIIVHGCSSILCQQSEVSIVNCHFGGIQGSLGAAMFISESNPTFSGNIISFIANTASYGGSLYLFKSSALLNRFTLSATNNSSKNLRENGCGYTPSKNRPTAWKLRWYNLLQFICPYY